MYPILYLQEHYPVLIQILSSFPPQTFPEQFIMQCNSQLYMKEFASEIEEVIQQNEQNSTSSLNLVFLFDFMFIIALSDWKYCKSWKIKRDLPSEGSKGGH